MRLRTQPMENRIDSEPRVFSKSTSFGVALAAVILLLAPSGAFAQHSAYATPDAVELFTPGEGGGRGQEYLPDNVLGLPDTVGRRTVPTTDPKQILSLGLDGEIVLRFDRSAVIDGPGTDFTVFENPFYYSLGGKERLYAEPGEVSVSRDGVHYVSFPFDSLTLKGCAGVTPTNGDQPPYDPEVSGGDGFDLSEIGMDSVRFIRIRDVTRIVKNNPEHPYYDVTLNGFDLDAVVAVHAAQPQAAGLHEVAATDAMHVTVPSVVRSSDIPVEASLSRPGQIRWELFDITGRKVHGEVETRFSAGTERFLIPASELPNGTYFLIFTSEPFEPVTRTIRILR